MQLTYFELASIRTRDITEQRLRPHGHPANLRKEVKKKDLNIMSIFCTQSLQKGRISKSSVLKESSPSDFVKNISLRKNGGNLLSGTLKNFEKCKTFSQTLGDST